MDIDSEVGEGFNDFDVVTGNWHKGAWEEGSVGSLDLSLHPVDLIGGREIWLRGSLPPEPVLVLIASPTKICIIGKVKVGEWFTSYGGAHKAEMICKIE